ncbi:MAG TPA: TRAP transporter small permease [Albitalea sp.]|nr:TRAP transporter small permease [Albitalea sp.]HJW12370.1 TRAP transporter small permease [Albitalea sp.]
MTTHAMPAIDAVAPSRPSLLRSLTTNFYRLLGALACLAMVAAFVVIVLGVAAREFGIDIAGLDAYAGYSIAAALFLALPMTLQRGDHIRVTLFLDKLPTRWRGALEYWSLASGLVLTLYVAVFACRLVWISYLTHDVSSAADATPLWIPQIAMALGSIGFALSFADALWARVRGRPFFENGGDEIARVE